VDRLRTSEAERQRVVVFLRDRCAEGRLGPDELDERLAAALRSRTRGELAALVADMPGGVAALPGGALPGAVLATAPEHRPARHTVLPAVAVLALLVVLVAVALPAPELLLLTVAAIVLATLVSVVLVSVAPWLAVGAAVVWAVNRLRERPGGEMGPRSP
jgi:hypothetical protein